MYHLANNKNEPVSCNGAWFIIRNKRKIQTNDIDAVTIKYVFVFNFDSPEIYEIVSKLPRSRIIKNILGSLICVKCSKLSKSLFPIKRMTAGRPYFLAIKKLIVLPNRMPMKVKINALQNPYANRAIGHKGTAGRKIITFDKAVYAT